MSLNITEEAADWYIQELALDTPAYIRFFPRYGFGGHIPGFSIGMNNDQPQVIYASEEVKGITFYIEHEDAWYFEDVKLGVILDKELNEPIFTHES